MAQRKSITKAVGKKPVVKTEKSKRLSKKQPTKVVTSKRPTSSSKGKKPTSKNTLPEKIFAEKLGSFITNIDSIQKTLETKDMDIVQKVFNNIVDDIILFLRLLPEIKDAKLLADYKKVNNKIDTFMKSLTFRFEINKMFSVDNRSKDTVVDEHSILLEKLTDGSINYYRVRYYSNGKPVSIRFGESSNARSVDNNEDNTLSIMNKNFTIKIRNRCDEFTLIESILINKDLYGSYFDKEPLYSKKRV